MSDNLSKDLIYILTQSSERLYKVDRYVHFYQGHWNTESLSKLPKATEPLRDGTRIQTVLPHGDKEGQVAKGTFEQQGLAALRPYKQGVCLYFP